MSIPSSESVPKQFVSAYYQQLLRGEEKQQLFYHDDASVFRAEIGENVAKKIDHKKDRLFPSITDNSELNIVDFVIVPKNDGFSINIFGSLIQNSNKLVFHQEFELGKFGSVYAIIYDLLSLKKNDILTAQGEEEYPPKKPAGQFAPYVPKK